jgi:hypothetical protein
MLDITRIAETVGGMLGQQSERSDLSGLLRQLGQAGIEPDSLSQLASSEIVDTLSQHGIDVKGLDGSQLADLFGEWTVSDQVGSRMPNSFDSSADQH